MLPQDAGTALVTGTQALPWGAPAGLEAGVRYLVTHRHGCPVTPKALCASLGILLSVPPDGV